MLHICHIAGRSGNRLGKLTHTWSHYVYTLNKVSVYLDFTFLHFSGHCTYFLSGKVFFSYLTNIFWPDALMSFC